MGGFDKSHASAYSHLDDRDIRLGEPNLRNIAEVTCSERASGREPISFEDGDQEVYRDLLAEQTFKRDVEVFSLLSDAQPCALDPRPIR